MFNMQSPHHGISICLSGTSRGLGRLVYDNVLIKLSEHGEEGAYIIVLLCAMHCSVIVCPVFKRADWGICLAMFMINLSSPVYAVVIVAGESRSSRGGQWLSNSSAISNYLASSSAVWLRIEVLLNLLFGSLPTSRKREREH